MLFPYHLGINTPRSSVSWAGYEIPPEAFSVTEERQIEVLQLLNGRGLARAAQYGTLSRIRIVCPDGFALPGDRAGALKDLQIGDTCTIFENLSNRSALTTWTNAIVWAAPVVPRIGFDPSTGTEYYSYQLEFVHMET